MPQVRVDLVGSLGPCPQKVVLLIDFPRGLRVFDDVGVLLHRQLILLCKLDKLVEQQDSSSILVKFVESLPSGFDIWEVGPPGSQLGDPSHEVIHLQALIIIRVQFLKQVVVREKLDDLLEEDFEFREFDVVVLVFVCSRVEVLGEVEGHDLDLFRVVDYHHWATHPLESQVGFRQRY